MKNLKSLRFVPKKVLLLGLLAITISFFAIAVEYSLAQLLQIYTYHLGFIKNDQVTPWLKWLTEDKQLFFFLLIGSVFGRGVFQFCLNFINIAFAETFIFEMRKKFLEKIFDSNGEHSFNLGHTSNIFGEVLPKSSTYITTLARFVTLSIQAVGLGALCLYSMPREFLFTVLIFAFIAPIIFFLNRKSKSNARGILKKNELLNTQLMTSIKNFIFIKILGLETTERKKTEGLAKEYYQSFLKNNFIYSISSTMPNTVALSVIFLLFYYFNSSGSSGASLLTLFYLLNRFIQSLTETMALTTGINMYGPNFEELMNIVGSEYSRSKKVTSLIPLKPQRNLIDFELNIKDLAFSYNEKEKAIKVFENLSFNLPSKNILVIKGKSGSGKSTLLMSLIGVNPPTEGDIFWGGENLRTIEKRLFRKHIGFLGPEPYILNATIKENLFYGLNELPTEKELEDACKLSHSLEFINSLPSGFNSTLTEQGEGLSMGQKQRLGLARALLRKPKILILDEITANLDKDTEKKIVKNIENLRNEMTVLVATHSSAFDKVADKMITF